MAECEHLGRTSAYFDGALATSERAAAVAHLATCAECQALLGDAVGIDAVLSTRRVRRARWPFVVAGGLAVAAAIVVWLVWPRPASSPGEVALALPRARAVEARFTAAPFAAHRPLDALRGGDRAREPISLAELAALEHRGEPHALVAALAATGDLARATELAAKLPDDVASAADRAALALAGGDVDRALAAADRALDRDPGARAALWNRALAARSLGLPRVAERDFAAIVAAREPGWADEATQDLAALDQDLARDRGYKAFEARAVVMIAGGAPLTEDDVTHYPARTRIAFWDAARLAPDRARLEALRPLAAALDRASGVTTAAVGLDRIDPKLSTRFAARYRALIEHTASAADSARLIDELRAAGHGADDLRAGAIVLAGTTRLDELAQLTAPWHDPWFTLHVERERIRRAFPNHDLRAEQPLVTLLASCNQAAWPSRCGSIAQDLGELELATGDNEAAERHAVRALELQRQAQFPVLSLRARALVAEVHRLRGLSARARAEFEELELAAADAGDCDITRYAQIGVTEIAIAEGDARAARASLPPPDPPAGCRATPDLVGVSAAVDLARHFGDAADRTVAERWIAATADAEGGVSIVGALRIHPGASTAAARRWVDAHRGATDPVIAGVRAWGITTLFDEAAQRGAWSEMFELVAAPVTGACRVVASADDDTLAIAIDREGTFDGEHRGFTDLATTPVISDRLVTLLGACSDIAVIAPPPLHGRSDLLPAALPWWFVGDAPPHAPTSARRTLEVVDAHPPDPALAPLVPGKATVPFDQRLAGDAASPAAVLAALATASYAELHVHGLVAASDRDAAYLALSPDPDGRFALRADAVRAAHFANAPLVVLAACRAASVAPLLRMRWSLPDAFVTAGASAVIAADVAIPNGDARRVFDELHRKIAAGEPAARALAAIRAAEPAGAWARHLVLFR